IKTDGGTALAVLFCFWGKEENRREDKADSSLRKPTRSQEVNAKKKARLASLGMTGLGGTTELGAVAPRRTTVSIAMASVESRPSHRQAARLGLEPGFLHCASRRVRSEANAIQKAGSLRSK